MLYGQDSSISFGTTHVAVETEVGMDHDMTIK